MVYQGEGFMLGIGESGNNRVGPSTEGSGIYIVDDGSVVSQPVFSDWGLEDLISRIGGSDLIEVAQRLGDRGFTRLDFTGEVTENGQVFGVFHLSSGEFEVYDACEDNLSGRRSVWSTYGFFLAPGKEPPLAAVVGQGTSSLMAGINPNPAEIRQTVQEFRHRLTREDWVRDKFTRLGYKEVKPGIRCFNEQPGQLVVVYPDIENFMAVDLFAHVRERGIDLSGVKVFSTEGIDIKSYVVLPDLHRNFSGFINYLQEIEYELVESAEARPSQRGDYILVRQGINPRSMPQVLDVFDFQSSSENTATITDHYFRIPDYVRDIKRELISIIDSGSETDSSSTPSRRSQLQGLSPARFGVGFASNLGIMLAGDLCVRGYEYAAMRIFGRDEITEFERFGAGFLPIAGVVGYQLIRGAAIAASLAHVPLGMLAIMPIDFAVAGSFRIMGIHSNSFLTTGSRMVITSAVAAIAPFIGIRGVSAASLAGTSMLASSGFGILCGVGIGALLIGGVGLGALADNWIGSLLYDASNSQGDDTLSGYLSSYMQKL